ANWLEYWWYGAAWEKPFNTAFADPCAKAKALPVSCATVPFVTLARYLFGKDRKVCSAIRAGKLSANKPTPPRITVFPSPRISRLKPKRGCTMAPSIDGSRLLCPAERVAL